MQRQEAASTHRLHRLSSQKPRTPMMIRAKRVVGHAVQGFQTVQTIQAVFSEGWFT
jgi:hypothetical protein